MPRSVERRVETLCTHDSIGRAAELEKIGGAMKPARTTRPKRGYTAGGGAIDSTKRIQYIYVAKCCKISDYLGKTNYVSMFFNVTPLSSWCSLNKAHLFKSRLTSHEPILLTAFDRS